MSETNFFDDMIARSPRKAGAVFLAIGLALLGFAVLSFTRGDGVQDYAVVLAPALLMSGLLLLVLGSCPQWLQAVVGVAGLGLGCWALSDLKSPTSLILSFF